MPVFGSCGKHAGLFVRKDCAIEIAAPRCTCVRGLLSSELRYEKGYLSDPMCNGIARSVSTMASRMLPRAS